MKPYVKRLLLGALLFSGTLRAEDSVPIDPTMHAEDDAYLNRQAAALLAEVEQSLAQHSPQLPAPRERRLALLLMDGILHEKYAPNRPAVQAFYQGRMEKALQEMEATKVGEGARIWKLYNHAFVVRTASVTLGFDLNPGIDSFRVNDPAGERSTVPAPGFAMDASMRERLVRQCDVLFISHRHRDHADASIATLFLEAGKPVVGPPEVFEGQPIEARLTRLERDAGKRQPLPVQEGRQTLQVVAYPGQQYQGSGIPNNVVLVYTPEGLTFLHNGDQINDPYPAYQEDFKWIDQIATQHTVDVFMTNCWTNDLLRMTRGIKPKLVLPGHENELGHPLWDRVPYWGDEQFLHLNNAEVKKEYPVLVMTWGEGYSYTRAGE